MRRRVGKGFQFQLSPFDRLDENGQNSSSGELHYIGYEGRKSKTAMHMRARTKRHDMKPQVDTALYIA